MRTITVIRLKRMKAGFNSAFSFACACGVDGGRYSMFEGAGKYRRLKSDEVERVASILGCPVSQIVNEKGYPVLLNYREVNNV